MLSKDSYNGPNKGKYWCGSCCDWVKAHEVLIGSKYNHGMPTCPEIGCHCRVRIRARHKSYPLSTSA